MFVKHSLTTRVIFQLLVHIILGCQMTLLSCLSIKIPRHWASNNNHSHEINHIPHKQPAVCLFSPRLPEFMPSCLPFGWKPKSPSFHHHYTSFFSTSAYFPHRLLFIFLSSHRPLSFHSPPSPSPIAYPRQFPPTTVFPAM